MAIRRAPSRPLSLAEFLVLPETKPASELIAGEVAQKPVAKIKHNLPIMRLALLLQQSSLTRSGTVLAEQGLIIGGDLRVPDLVWFAERALVGDQDYPSVPPLLAVEVRSDGQTLASQRAKLAFLRARGVAATVLIDPERGSVEAIEDGRTSTATGAQQVTIAALGGFSFSAADLFSS